MEKLERVEHSLKRNELIISVDEYDINPGYQERMLVENDIKGLCALRVLYTNDTKEYCYEISNYETLKEIGKYKRGNYEFLKHFLAQIVYCFEMLDKFMVEEDKILFAPQYIFCDKFTGDISLIYFPYKEDENMDFVSLTEYLLEIVDQEDPLAVWTVYMLEGSAKMENFSLLAFLDKMNEHEEMLQKEIELQNELEGESEEVENELSKIKEIEERLGRGKKQIQNFMPLISGIVLALTYFGVANLISKVYMYEYEKSMLIIAILTVVTVLILAWNLLRVIKARNREMIIDKAI
jgi:hypothetical protein